MSATPPVSTDPDDQPIDFGQTHTREYINGQVNKFAQQRDEAASEANEMERSLCAQLMLLTTVLLTANLVALSDHSNLTALTHQQSLLVFTSLLGLSSSTIAGIKYYFANVKFYNGWADKKNKAVTYLIGKHYQTIREAQNRVKRLQKGETEVSPIWLRVQIWLLLIVLISYILFIAALLFSFKSFQGHFPFSVFGQ